MKARPATAPGKRLLSAKVSSPRQRPKSAWGDATTSYEIVQNQSEISNQHKTEHILNQEVLEEIILNPNGLNVQGDYGYSNNAIAASASCRDVFRTRLVYFACNHGTCNHYIYYT